LSFFFIGYILLEVFYPIPPLEALSGIKTARHIATPSGLKENALAGAEYIPFTLFTIRFRSHHATTSSIVDSFRISIPEFTVIF